MLNNYTLALNAFICIDSKTYFDGDGNYGNKIKPDFLNKGSNLIVMGWWKSGKLVNIVAEKQLQLQKAKVDKLE